MKFHICVVFFVLIASVFAFPFRETEVIDSHPAPGLHVHKETVRSGPGLISTLDGGAPIGIKNSQNSD